MKNSQHSLRPMTVGCGALLILAVIVILAASCSAVFDDIDIDVDRPRTPSKTSAPKTPGSKTSKPKTSGQGGKVHKSTPNRSTSKRR